MNDIIIPNTFNDHEAEYIFLRRVFYDPRNCSRAVYYLFADVFSHPEYREIYEEVRLCLDENVIPGSTEVYMRLRKKGKTGAAQKAIEATVNNREMSDIESAASFLSYNWYKRNFGSILYAAFSENNDIDSDPRIIRKKMGDLFELMDNRLPSMGRNANSIAMEILIESERVEESAEEYIPVFGIQEMDNTIFVEPTDYVLIGGRPSMGKTSLLLKIAHTISQQKRFKLYSMETSAKIMVKRIISSISGIPFKMLKDITKLSMEQAVAYQNAVGAISSYLEIEDKMFNVEEIIMDLYGWANKGNCGGWGMDHIGLAETTKRSNTKEEKLSEISRQLKKACMKTEIPGFILSQLSREVEKRSTKRPELGDLRDSGALEQDADIVIFPWRPEYYGFQVDSKGNDLTGACKMLIAKYKNGGKRSILTSFDETTMAFGPYTKQLDLF